MKTDYKKLYEELKKKFEKKIGKVYQPYQLGGCANCGFRGHDIDEVTNEVLDFIQSAVEEARKEMEKEIIS